MSGRHPQLDETDEQSEIGTGCTGKALFSSRHMCRQTDVSLEYSGQGIGPRHGDLFSLFDLTARSYQFPSGRFTPRHLGFICSDSSFYGGRSSLACSLVILAVLLLEGP